MAGQNGRAVYALKLLPAVKIPAEQKLPGGVNSCTVRNGSSPARSCHQSCPHTEKFCAMQSSEWGALEKTKPWQREGARDSLDCDTLLPWETRRLLGKVLPWCLQEAWWTSKVPGGFLKMWLWILFIQVTVYIQHMLATWNLSQPLSLGVLFTCLQH